MSTDENVPGQVHEYGLWAQVSDAGSTDFEEDGGTRVERRRMFTIRWRRDVIASEPNLVSIIDEYGRDYKTAEITEATDPQNRRRFLDIVGVMT